MIRYLLTAIVFPPGGSVRQSCTQKESKQLYMWGRNNTLNNTKT